MPTFIDPLLKWPKTKVWKWGWVSHLYADTAEELHEFAARLGLKREWCSDHTQPGSKLLHYDLNPSKRTRAVVLGAIEVSHEHKLAYYRTIEARKAELEARK